MKISVVTPSLNQARFIAATINSVRAQAGDFGLEHIVVDGGSTDETLEILRGYGDGIKWISGRDSGQSDAINKGLAMATGDILAWLNSDDTYEQGALSLVVEEYKRTSFRWCFGNCRNIDEQGKEIRRAVSSYKVIQSRGYSFSRLLRRDFISQPSAFFSRAAFIAAGPLDTTLRYSMDYDYWLRLGRGGPPSYIDKWLANFRWHGESKNGSLYRAAAWETFKTAVKHARGRERLQLPAHLAHVIVLNAVYPLLPVRGS